MGSGTFFDIRDSIPETHHIHVFDDAKDKWWADGGYLHLHPYRKQLDGWLDDINLFEFCHEEGLAGVLIHGERRVHRSLTKLDRALLKLSRGKGLSGVLLNDKREFKPVPSLKLRDRFTSGMFTVIRENDLWQVHPTRWVPAHREELLEEASRHSDKCRELDQKRGGRRARKLLFENLSPFQQAEYERYGYFHVLKFGPLEGYFDLPLAKQQLFAKAPNQFVLRYRRYRIHRGYPNGNIQLVTHRGEAVLTFCIHPEKPFPNDDTLLAQKLLIESSEAKFIADANISYATSAHDFEPVDSFAKWCRHREQARGKRGIRRR